MNDGWTNVPTAPAPTAPAPTPPTYDTPTTFTPVARPVARPAAAPRAQGSKLQWIVIGVLAVLAAGAYVVTRGGDGGSEATTPQVLAPIDPAAGLPSSIDAAMRIRAESSRHLALQTVAALAAEDPAQVDATRLGPMAPSLQWVGGDADSTDATVVSVANQSGTIVVAVAAPKRICAFGRLTAGSPAYVTMQGVAHCRATAAPRESWSAQSGGAATDLPDDPY